MEIGGLLRTMRRERGLGIKRLAPELGVSYTYLSKIENSRAIPSDQLIERIADYFDRPRDQLLAAASRLPPDIAEILRNNPDEAVELLRERFGGRQS